MNCQEFQAIVVDLAGSRPIDAALRASALDHADTCAACAAMLVDQRLLSTELRALAQSAASVHAPARLESSLLSAFRAQSGRSTRSRSATRWYVWAAVAAACLVVAVLSARVVSTSRLSRTVARQARVQTPAPQVLPPAVPPRVEKAAPPVAAPVRRASVRPRRAAPAPVRHATQPPPPEDAYAGFMPLLYAAPAHFDSGQIVRMKLPPAALVSFGVPVNANRADPVQADVFFAEDGMARAIRFVK